jgi:hypothetical protein
MRRRLKSAMCAALGLSMWACHAWSQASATTAIYYPLAVGNTWKYEVHETGKGKSYVVWRVTKGTETKDGSVFQVWPTPMQSDDDAQTVIVKDGRVSEFESRTLLVGGGLKAGDSWAMSVNGRVVRRLRVLSSGKSCKGIGYSSPACITIADSDDRLSLLTVTCYAKGVGPVWFKYYDSRKPVESSPESIVELVSYKVKE